MPSNELNFENLFSKALTELIEKNSGSLDDALFDLRIDANSKLAKQIKDWYGWEEE